MNKTELVKRISSRAMLKERDVSNMINAAVEEITSAILRGESVKIRDFGTFMPVDKSRKYRNPNDGSVIEIKNRRFCKFAPGRWLKQ